MSELKTLKDMQSYAGWECDQMDETVEESFKRWKELDINNYREDTHISYKEVKEEAIKHYRKEINTEYYDEPKTAYEWIEEFFNLTPEDLKNEST